jgi:hypothetical protein
MASWLSGPRAAAEQMGVDLGYRGQRYGLPEEGPGSMAGAGRRIVALFIDWLLCMLIAYGLLSADRASIGNWTLVIFVVMAVLTVGTIGTTPGKRLLGLRVVSVLFAIASLGDLRAKRGGPGKSRRWSVLPRSVP